MAQNFRQGQILSQNFTANPTVVFSSPGDSRSGDREAIQKGHGRKFSMKLFSELEF
jgi:hypothetical protein